MSHSFEWYIRVPPYPESIREEYYTEPRHSRVRQYARPSGQVFRANGQHAVSLSPTVGETAK